MTEGIKTPSKYLEESAALYHERNAIYGDNYKSHGRVMLALFPAGVNLLTADDHNRFGILTQIVAKLTRYTVNFSGGGHDDSLADIATYSAMLREIDAGARELARLWEDMLEEASPFAPDAPQTPENRGQDARCGGSGGYPSGEPSTGLEGPEIDF